MDRAADRADTGRSADTGNYDVRWQCPLARGASRAHWSDTARRRILPTTSVCTEMTVRNNDISL